MNLILKHFYTQRQESLINTPLNNTEQNQSSFQAFGPMVSRWLSWQSSMISGIKTGAVFLINDNAEKSLDKLAIWPEKTAENVTKLLIKLASNAISNHDVFTTKITIPSKDKVKIYDAIALPIHHGKEIIGVTVFLQTVHSEEHKKAVYPLLQWGCTWLESNLLATYEEQSQLNPLVTDLSQLSLKKEPLALTAHQACNLLTQRLDCSRVIIGIKKALQINTIALSNQLRFDHRSSDLRKIESAMEESVDQKESISYPTSKNQHHLMTYKHQALATNQEGMGILTIPLFCNGDPIGAIVLMRTKNRPFTDQEIKIIQSAATMLGPIFNLKLHNEQSIKKLLRKNSKTLATKIFGSGHLKFKLSLFTLAFALILLSIIHTPYNIYAKSTLEGAIQQIIVAPQDGFVKSSLARAGDIVNKDQVLLTLEDTELKLEQEVLFGEQAKLNKEYQEELANGQRAKISILLAKILQINAQINLIQEKLNRSQLKAPFTGLVVSGDLSQSIGIPVQKGEQLFEVALMEDYRVALDVDEYDLSKLKLQQTGNLRLLGLPYQKIPIRITRITPLAVGKDGGNFFRVEAALLKIDRSQFKPGMQGIAKIEVGEDRVLWVWTHALMDRLRLWLWSIGL